MMRLRVPSDDGGILAVPALSELAGVAERNAALCESWADDSRNAWLVELRRAAQARFCELGRDYLRRLGFDHSVSSRRPLILAGHQPQLAHAGVWVKHFVVAAVAQATGGSGWNLVLDSDTAGAATIRVPTGTADQPTVAEIQLDTPEDNVQWEQWRVHDPQQFRAAGRAIEGALGSWGYAPLAAVCWPRMTDRLATSAGVADLFTAARHELEVEWGVANGETPVAAVCRTPEYAQFANRILNDLDQFVRVHNSALAAHRRLNRIRTRQRPVPDLVATSGRLEAPFWVFSGRQPRRRLFVECSAATLSLFAGDEPVGAITRDPQSDRAAQPLLELMDAGLQIRPRAITNTLFCRLFICDLFVHGIGGAKYDEVTDQIIREFVGVEPPRYATVSATVRIPVDRHACSMDDVRRLCHLQRDLTYNPDRHLDEPAPEQALSWKAQKWQWIEKQCTSATQRRERFRAIRQINQRLQTHVPHQAADVAAKLVEVSARIAANRILADRAYSFICLSAEQVRHVFASATRQITARPPAGSFEPAGLARTEREVMDSP